MKEIVFNPEIPAQFWNDVRTALLSDDEQRISAAIRDADAFDEAAGREAAIRTGSLILYEITRRHALDAMPGGEDKQ